MDADYEALERIFDGTNSMVSRGRRRSDGAPVILKQLRERHPTPAQLAAFEREFDVTSSAAGAGVIAVYELHRELGLVVEDYGARSLAMILRERRLTLEETLRVAIQVADALSRIHRKNIVHRDVNPSNIVLNEATGVAKLIDFGIAQVLTRESSQTFEGTPRYASPEQTGRMNRTVDPRSDLYSLGVTLYELLSGAPPFEFKDQLELVHAHVARIPVPLHEKDPRIPRPLSRIVGTLLQKQAERRYLGAAGLRHDLARCLELAAQGRAWPTFPLREKDIDERLRIPQVLYGREREVARLADACATSADGRARVVMVAGHPGIGKTSLVHEVRRLLAGGRGRTVEGKYDQFERGQPYSGFLEALRDLVRQLLTEPEETIASVRERVLSRLNDNGRVLLDLAPELVSIIGRQPEVEALPATEAKHRLQLAIASLVQALATSDRPLVMFFDDLQWADLPSFELLERVIGDPNLKHVLVCGAYRNQEVPTDHALFSTVRALEAHVTVDTIVLGPLAEEDVARLVSDAVYAAPGHAALAAACYARTHGNAFFLNRFLESLAEDSLLRFDPSLGYWTWDLEAILARPVTENVVDFLAERIGRLPVAERACLLDASAIGDSFDLFTLSAARDATRRDTLRALEGAIRAELVVPEATGFWYVQTVDEVHTNFTWRFAHDRIRQAAHALLPAPRALEVHLRVGRHLLRALGVEELEQRVFEVVLHLSKARVSLGRVEQLELKELQLVAGRRALGSAAFGAAHEIFTTALEEEDAFAWTDRYDHTLSLYLDAARAAWLSGDRETMDRLVLETLAHARSTIDEVRAREIEIDALVGQQRLGDAVETALAVLVRLGVTFPADPGDAEIGAAVGATLDALAATTADAIVAMPEVHTAEIAAATRIQNAIMSSAYLARPRLFPLLPCSIVQTTLRHGVTRESPYAFALFAIVLNVIDQIDVAYATGAIALRLLDRWDDRAVRVRVEHVIHNQVNTYTDHIRRSLDAQLRVFRLGMDTGDLEYAAWGLQCICCNAFYAGEGLAELGPRVDRYLALMRLHEQFPALACSEPWKQVIQNLTGHAADPARLAGPEFDEIERMTRWRAANFRGAACIVTTTGAFVRFIFRDLEAAIAWADAGGEFRDGAGSTYHVVWWHQYRALAHLGLNRSPEGVAADVLKLETLCKFSPQNHQHRVDLLHAEIARVRGMNADAIVLYDRAIMHARQNRFLHEEALANELAGRFYSGLGLATPARAYVEEGAWLYRRWGATAKAAHLELEFATLLGATRTSAPGEGRPTGRWTTGSGGSSGNLDMDTLFKAGAAISSEIQLDRLLSRILEVAIENVGATRGLLFLDHERELRVAASIAVDGAEIAIGTAVSSCPPLAANVVSYVTRAGEPVLVSDVRDDNKWQAATAFTSDHPTSVLCLPVDHKGARVGLIYLENDLVGGAFTAKSAEVVRLLSIQAAISIANARLYQTLEEASRELQRKEAYVSHLLETVPVGVFVTDRDGRPDYANPEAHRLLGQGVAAGASRDQLAEAYHVFVEGTDTLYPAERMPIVQALSGVSAFCDDMEVRDGDRARHLSVTATPVFGEDGAVEYAIAAFQDITEQKQAQKVLEDYSHTLEEKVRERTHAAEEAQRAAEDARRTAEAANHAKSSFLASMSHELRTPMNAIIGFTGLVLRRSGEALPLKQRENLDKVLVSAKHLLELINDVLDLSKIEAGRLDLHMTDVAVGSVATDCVEIVEVIAESRSIVMSVEIDPSLPLVVADAAKVREILLNLVGNALKFTAPGGSVSVHVRSGEMANVGTAVLVAVKDTGVGISPDLYEAVFGEFHQVKSGTSRQTGGTGLGLAISRRLARLMGGDVRVESVPDVGSTFTLGLPVSATPPMS